MKKITLLIVLAFAVFAVNAQEKPVDKVVIEGSLDKAYNNSHILIVGVHPRFVDSVQIEKGKFRIELPFTEAVHYSLSSTHDRANKKYAALNLLLAEPGNITIQGGKDGFASSLIQGSAENDLLKPYQDMMAAEGKKVMETLQAKYGKKFMDTVSNKNPKIKEISNDYRDLAMKTTEVQKQASVKFVEEHPGSFAAVYLLNNYYSRLKPEEAERLYNQLGGKFKDVPLASQIQASIQKSKATDIGATAPLFAQADTNGVSVSLESFRGNYVLIDFWASWCGPCRAENPNVVKAYNEFHPKGFQILGISLDQGNGKEKWLDAIHKDNLTWTQVSDLKGWKNEVALLYAVRSIPQNFLIDPQGKIVAKNLRGERLEEKLREIYK